MKDKSDVVSPKPRKLPFQLLTEITDNFAPEQKLGSGAFGDVYKGVLKDGVVNQVIAVKKLRFLINIDDKQFKNEFELLTRLKHQNIVQLVGFCDDTEEVLHLHEGKMIEALKIHRALCLEFVPNGNLGTFLSEQRLVLNWDLRFKIIKGICEGLKYLHDVPLNHLDLKPENILLDEKMVPKIADFGISRLVGTQNTVMTLTPLGTLGYIPPEFIKKQVISREFDIFSLGVIIKKMMTTVMDDSNIAFAGDQECIANVHNYWRKRLQGIPGHASLEADCEQVRTCIEIAVVCMDEDPRRRPTMKYIVRKLNKKEPKENDTFSSIEQGGEPIIPESNIPGSSSTEVGLDARGKTEESWPGTVSTLPKELPLDFLKAITDDFSDARLLGVGPFGKLYKGVLPGGEMIAVRKLGRNMPVLPDKAFDNEVTNIMALQHENIVKLVGYCRVAQETVVEQKGRYVVADTADCLVCYEYLPKGSLLDHMLGSNSMDWDTRFKIIKGICQGLLFLHRIPIVHMDLKPGNILLDDNMVPKISDFFLSRLLGQEQTRANTQNVVGSYGYIAPEYLYRGEISTRSDIYSLGLLIMETVTGETSTPQQNEPSARKYIDKVRQNWTDLCIASNYSKLESNSLREVKVCLQIGLACVEIDRLKRPSIEAIVDWLGGLHVRDTMLETTSGSNIPLSIQPSQLRFPFEPKRSISCLFSLTNTTDDRVAFTLVTENPRRYLTKLPLSGVVPPNCTYTLNVTMREQKQLPRSNTGEFLTLQSSTWREKELTNTHEDTVATEVANDSGEVKEVNLPVVCDPREGTSSNQESIQSAAEIIASQNYRQVLSVDVHPNKPWILTSNQRGNICIWDYQKQAEVKFFEVSAEEPVYSAIFIEREEWVVAGGGDGYIYVYNYDKMDKIEDFPAHDGHHIRSLAACATHSFLLSASDDHEIKIWDWKNSWGCMRTFQGHSNSVTQVIFDPNDSISFASSSLDHTVKLWDIYSATCNATLDGQPNGVLCLHYFTDENRQFLLSGSSDGAAKIWDMEKECCVSALGGDAKSVNALCWHPELGVLVTGSLDGTVQIWKSTKTAYRLENIIGFNLGAVNAIGYIKGLRRIVVGCEQGIAMMEINLQRTYSHAQGRWALSPWRNVIGRRQ